MPTVLGTIQWDAFFKELYPSGLPMEILMRKHPFLTMVAKQGEAFGDRIVVPITIDNPSGRSADMATLLSANGPISPSRSRKFEVTLASDYAGHWINELTIRQAASDRGSFVSARKFEVDGLLRQLGNSMAHALYRDGTGSIGQGNAAWTLTGNVITLSNRADTKFFGLGMLLDFSSNVGGNPGVLRVITASNRAMVTRLDEDAGTVTCGLDSNGAVVANISLLYTALTNADFMHSAGDYVGSTGGKLVGLAGWLPLLPPTSALFWGVDRTEHPTRLAGNRLNDPTAPAEDSIMSLAEVMHERGANPDCALLSPRQFTKASKRLNAKVEYDGAGGSATYGFSNIKIATSAGTVSIFADPDCPEDRGYLVTKDSWVVRHLGLGEVGAADGLTALRRQGLDQIEIRAKYYAQLLCKAPGENGVFSVS